MFFTILGLAIAGSLVRGAAEFILYVAARRATAPVAAGTTEREHFEPMTYVDPVLTVGFVLGCYGAIALALLSAYPGAFALERTMLTFALLCVGGLIGEITKSRAAPAIASEPPDAAAAPPRARVSKGLSLALMLTLNLAVAVLGTPQGLIDILPSSKSTDARAQELDAIQVIARRPQDPLEPQAELF